MANRPGPGRATGVGPRIDRAGSGWSSIQGYLFEKHIAYLLIFPTLLGIVLVNVYPLVYTFVLSFQEYKLSSATGRWIGFANYTKILSDREVWNSIWISIVFTGASVGISFVIGLALALLLNRRMRGRHVVRSV